MNKTATQAHLMIVSFSVPDDLAPFSTQYLEKLGNFAHQSLGWQHSYLHVQSHLEQKETVHSVLSGLTQHNTELNLLLLIGHGKQSTLPGHQHPNNFLLCHDTDQEHISLSTFNLDDLINTLAQAKELSPTLVVIDACEVEVRSNLDAGSSQLAALLAHPCGSAEIEHGQSLLTTGLYTSLEKLSRAHHPPSLRELTDEVRNYVKRESHERQIPELTPISSSSFLDQTLPLKSPSAQGDSTLHALMVSLCLRDQLSEEALTDLERSLKGTSNPSSELSFIVKVKRYELLCRHYNHLNEPEKSELARYQETINERLERDDLSPLVDATARHLKIATERASSLDSFEKQFYLRQALKRLDEEPDSQTTKVLKSRIYDTLGSLLRDIGNQTEASSSYEKSMRFKMDLDDQLGMEITRQNLGWFYLACGNFKQAAEVFQEGREKVKQSLQEIAQHTQQFQRYADSLSSWTIHTYGLLITQLIDQRIQLPQLDLDPLTTIVSDVDEMRRRLRKLQGWVRPLCFGELERLCLYVTGDFNVKPFCEVLHKEIGAAIELIKECQEHGIQRQRITQSWEDANPSEGTIFLHMTWLAVLSVLCRKKSYQTTPHESRGRLIEGLRSHNRYRSLPLSEHTPWSIDHYDRSLRLDISTWSDWGPLAPQKTSSNPDQYAPNFYVTTNFIQVLAWSHILLGLAEAQLTCSDAFPSLIKSGNAKDQSKQLSLGTYLTFARRLFNELTFKSEWGRKLKECWSTELVKKGHYRSLEELAEKRNYWAHSHNPTIQEAQDEMDRHQAMITYLSELIAYDDADVPQCIEHTQVTRTNIDALRSVILVNSRGHRFDCGPLLMTQRSAAVGQVYYLPYCIDKSVLEGNQGIVKYRRYGQTGGKDLGAEISLTYSHHE